MVYSTFTNTNPQAQYQSTNANINPYDQSNSTFANTNPQAQYQFAIIKKMAPCRFEKQSFANFGLLRQQLKRFLTSHVISSILTLPLHEFWSQQSAIICKTQDFLPLKSIAISTCRYNVGID